MGTVAVWRTQDTEDLFGIENNGIVSWRSWTPAGGWNPPSGPGVDLGTIASPFTQVSVVSRTPDTLDLFVIGFDGAVWSNFWNTALGWDPGGFFRVSPSGLFSSSTQIMSAISRAPDKLDLFAIGTDGVVRSTFWNAAEGWNPTWFSIHPETVFDQPPQNVYARSRTPDAIELFVLGSDTSVFWWTFWTAAGGWDPGGWVKVQPTRSVARGVQVVSRTPDTLDLFAIGSDNAVWSTFWNQGKGWNPWGWFRLAGGTFFDPASQGVSVVTREADALDLFVIGSDNSIYWSAPQGGWAQSWFRIGTATIFNHETQKVSAISGFPNKIDLFVIGTDDRVWSTFWTAAEGWRPQGWFHVPGTTYFDNMTQLVSVVSRTPDTLDLFAIGDGVVSSTFWNEANGWLGDWFPVASGMTFDNATDKLSVISRAPDKLDLFVARADGTVWSTFWNAADGWLGSWFQLGSVPFSVSQPLAVVSRTPDTIDLFAGDGDGRAWSAHWDAANGWSPGIWFSMYPGQFDVGGAPSQQVSAISRTPDDIDLFLIASLPYLACFSTFWTSTKGEWGPHGWFPILPTAIYEATT